MVVCGVDIRSNEAVVALVEGPLESAKHIKSETNRITLGDERDAKSLFAMKLAIEAFARQHHVEAFAIKTRQGKGQMASSGVTFKIEALFQLSETPVAFVSPQSITKIAKADNGRIPANVFAYQADAYRAAVVHLSKT